MVTKPSLGSVCPVNIKGNAKHAGEVVWHSPRPGHSRGKMAVPTAGTPGQNDPAPSLGSSWKLNSKAGSGRGER